MATSAANLFITCQTKFAPSMTVRHAKLGYLGVIFDVDATFSRSDEWYELMESSEPDRNQPWYHILVDGEDHTTYVCEAHLLREEEVYFIDHPLFSSLFTSNSRGIAPRTIVN